MNCRWISSILAFLLTLVLAGCTTVRTQEPHTQSPVPRVQKVIALSSLSADIIAYLDQTKLVGITGSRLFKDDPKFKDIPRVSEGQGLPSLEKIVALKPDLVIGASGFSDVTLKRLEELKIRTLSTKVNSWQSLEDITKTLAEVINVDPQSLLNRYKSFLPEKLNQTNSTLVLVSRQPILTPNKNSWAGDLLTKFGIKNVAAELQGNSPIGGYVTLSAEKVLEANPDSLIVVNAESTLLDSLKKETFWQQLQATKNNRVYVFDYYGLVNPGSLNAIEKACQQLKDNLL
ncbi:ABC transporter substrate-binding protein [Cronbergia sp. UHCC 0137]|uniref:ABC transporter substrate-binding protein n=1 Tax=Cronbergia sp. UHCC 0137 TaxID=3110239 RepID=UPI002B215A04|nr:ABC transporter substrate-binding protein [Cronbergia sp. UHCC 0137]MEA5616874.1 ABC transporter substrate-binding protein [Cronbergia sp. UHCC 0137]